MPSVRDILNKLKWRGDKDFNRVEVWYRHRGAPNDTKLIMGEEIVSVGKSFLETKTAMIPYHRVLKIVYEGEVLFDRSKI
ncbi:MAG TPA: DUF504 domain-containing protein [Thermoplasmatales archaeon]|nr:DUF504 domain-containing protein [Thermoplasmatales archaeon]